ncbi:MAG: YggT family protein [Candidatus Omnitrophica bacterium]|nr:YggT family protein [Candidatus Omnitrophota bacterium]
MFVLSEVFKALAFLVDKVFSIIYFLLIIRIVLSWFQIYSYSEIIQILYKITDPILRPFRRLPLRIGMIDLSPMVAFLVLWFLRNVIVGILWQLALRTS